jgi:RNA-dependent RNA polymerase
MLLEGRGVKRDAFLRLQDTAIAKAELINDSFERFRDILKSHSFGRSYGLDGILQKLESLRLDLKDGMRIASADSPFLKRLRSVAKTAVLRDIKHRARIAIPKSYHLIGVADNGEPYLETQSRYGPVYDPGP